MRKCLIAATACLVFTSCELDFSGNGELDGFWQMTSADTLATGGIRDMHEDRIYWSVQKKLIEVRDIPEEYYGVLFHFEHSGGRLSLREPYLNKRDSGDIEITDVARLNRYGINALEETFGIIELNSDAMTLQSDVLRLHFRKY